MGICFFYVEWPREKNSPTPTGRWPAAMRRRVMRSMACFGNGLSGFQFCMFGRDARHGTEMWSASSACRRPSVYDSTAVERSALSMRRKIPQYIIFFLLHSQ